MYKPKTKNKREKSGEFFGVGIENPLSSENIGTLWRSAYLMGASFIFTIGSRYKKQKSDTTKTPTQIPLFQYTDFEEFVNSKPHGTKLIGVEINDNSQNLTKYSHFERSIYLLGSESEGLSERALEECHDLIYVPSKGCLNVSATGSIILYDRILKLKL